MVALLDRRRYLSNLVRDVSETLEGKNGAGCLRSAGGKGSELIGRSWRKDA